MADNDSMSLEEMQEALAMSLATIDLVSQEVNKRDVQQTKVSRRNIRRIRRCIADLSETLDLELMQ